MSARLQPRGLPWEEYGAARVRRRWEARRAAEAALHGELAPAVGLLHTWTAGEGARAALVARLVDAPPRPDAASLAELMLDIVPRPAGPERPGWLWREAVVDLELPFPEPSVVQRVTWGLDALTEAGHGVQARLRGPWHDVGYRVDAAADREAARMWRGWLEGAPFDVWRAWREAYAPPLVAAFRAVLSTALPSLVSRRFARELRQDFDLWMVSGEPPGWRAVLTRVLERAPHPVAGTAAACGSVGRERLADGAVRRGTQVATSTALAWPDLGRRVLRSLAVRDAVRQGDVDRLVDLHLARRLVDAWAEGQWSHPRDAWDHGVRQSWGRMRARVRAVLGEDADAGGEVLQLHALHARTVAAMRDLGRDLGFRVLSAGTDVAIVDLVADPPCEAATPLYRPPGAEDWSALRAWVLLVALRGRLPALLTWVRTREAPRGGAAAALFAVDLPDRLRDPLEPGRARAATRSVAAALWLHWDDVVLWLDAPLAAAAAVDDGRGPGVAQRLFAALEPFWHSEVRFPGSGYRRMIREARALRAREGGLPCPPS